MNIVKSFSYLGAVFCLFASDLVGLFGFRRVVSVSVLSLMLIPLVSNAAVISYTDRTAFEAVTNIDYTEDFESLLSLGASSSAFSGPITFASGLTASSASNLLFSVASGHSTNPTTAIGGNEPKTDSLNFDLGGDYFAFGGDFFQNDDGGAQLANPTQYSFSFYNNNFLVESITAMIAPNGGSFAGFVSDITFDYVEILSTPIDLYEIADNITVGGYASISEPMSIPEPFSLTLLGLGLAGIGFSRKKKVV